jgi:SAM-dependent methyltransferase
VTGIDHNAAALAEARRRTGAAVEYLEHDVRQVATLHRTFDAAIIMWQSFGYFDAATNSSILAQVARCLHPGGRFVLDVYHRGFFERHQGERQFAKSGVWVTARQAMRLGRLVVDLTYRAEPLAEPFGTDQFAWDVYAPDEITRIATEAGFSCLLACTEFDEAQAAAPENPRMQLVFVKD